MYVLRFIKKLFESDEVKRLSDKAKLVLVIIIYGIDSDGHGVADLTAWRESLCAGEPAMTEECFKALMLELKVVTALRFYMTKDKKIHYFFLCNKRAKRCCEAFVAGPSSYTAAKKSPRSLLGRKERKTSRENMKDLISACFKEAMEALAKSLNMRGNSMGYATSPGGYTNYYRSKPRTAVHFANERHYTQEELDRLISDVDDIEI